MEFVILVVQMKQVVDVQSELDCRCKTPNYKNLEFQINDDIIIQQNVTFSEIKKDYSKLKQKIICEYYEIINQMECGIYPDLSWILDEISLINSYKYD